MDDILKDVVNRGTAASASAWGFKNVPGQKAFAGKTGTSRDGWFAGFTPELVCVVYVGFDNGDDLGMKGADSALPVWADFMQKALAMHPEWNADWTAPPGVRKAEIDTRNGSLIRELDASADATPTPSPTPAKAKTTQNDLSYPDPAPTPQIYVTNVPAEFRRVELFISGTMPTRTLIQYDNPDGDGSKPEPSPTPLGSTWQDSAEPPKPETSPGKRADQRSNQMVTVMICPLTGMRATANCPEKESRSYKAGEEPKEFCTFHR